MIIVCYGQKKSPEGLFVEESIGMAYDAIVFG